METPNYNCAQEDLYPIMRTLYANCEKFIDDMHAFKELYSKEYCDARLAEIDAAEALPSAAQRAQEHETFRVELLPLAAFCCENFQGLKQYIMTAVPVELRIINYKAAGWAHYEEAAANNWSSVAAMVQMGIQYIATNKTMLMANKNMPAAFETTFTDAAAAFNAKKSAFTQSRENAMVLTADKIAANNICYSMVTEMDADGQFVFRNNEEKRKQFSFAAVAELESPAGASTAILTVMSSTTEKPIIAEIVAVKTERLVTTDDAGRGEFGGMAAGDTQFEITADGFTKQTVTMTLKTGTTSRMDVKMVPMFESVGGAVVPEVMPTA